MEQEPLLITIQEACKILHMGENTLYKLVKTPKFPAIILPHKILIDRNQLPTWISRNYGTYKK